MTERSNPFSEVNDEALVGYHNELAREANEAKDKLERLKGERGEDELMDDPDVSYLQGKVRGFDIATSGLHALIEARKLDDASLDAAIKTFKTGE
ncbi:MAG: hypothetical protein U5L95_02145 [Candidatus Saccharibacteria bacterium]|nr:hypothetical protein [Candidatus Saccharibacteria bacterium]